jgi:hypothetical protein
MRSTPFYEFAGAIQRRRVKKSFIVKRAIRDAPAMATRQMAIAKAAPSH